MAVIEIKDLNLPELAPYASLTERQLRAEGADGIFIAESPKVILSAIESGFRPISLLCEKKHISGDASPIIERFPDLTVFTGERELLSQLTGYTLTRGVLCAMHRPHLPSADDLLRNSSRICVIYDVCDTTNIGGIFRSAAALGFDGIILSPESCDPLNRRAIRVSMGSVFKIPWCYESDILSILKRHSFKSVCMALTDESIFLQDFNVDPSEKYAVYMGSEGWGLPSHIISSSDYVVKIPMHYGVDSLNVGAAAAITLWHFTRR